MHGLLVTASVVKVDYAVKYETWLCVEISVMALLATVYQLPNTICDWNNLATQKL